VIPWSVLADNSGWALVGVFVLCVFFGLLVPRRTIKDYERALERERARNDLVADTVSKLLVYAETSDRILRAWYRRSMDKGIDPFIEDREVPHD